MTVDILLGVPACFRRLCAVARDLGAPVLVSANALRKRGKFRPIPADLFAGCDVALDSAGFVAMSRYGGFPWTRGEYLGLVASFPWRWWAAMDFCCEPQIAKDRASVLHRVRATAIEFRETKQEAAFRGMSDPLPVLQGWTASDYLRCADLIGELAPVVGLGSVCRRPLHGRDGVAEIVDALDARLPSTTRFHLFGVKGAAIGALRDHPRIASMDSMAWDYACRRRAGVSRTVEVRSRWMREFYRALHSRVSVPGASWQSSLPFSMEFAA